MYSLPKNVYRERIDFSKIKTTVPIPNLIEIQKNSYERFLQMNRLPSEREDAGLQSVFKSVFPISDFPPLPILQDLDFPPLPVLQELELHPLPVFRDRGPGG